MNKPPIRQSTLSSQILGIFMEQIKDGTFSPEVPLPTEYQLASNYKVSRATIRSAMDKLEAMGLIARRPGRGTFIRSNSNLSNPLNQFIEFTKLIAVNGYEPGYKQLGTQLVDPSPEQVKMLNLTVNDKILEIKKVFLADNEPIIFCINYIPHWVFLEAFSDDQIIQPGVTLPILEFLEKKCGQSISYYVSSVRADVLKYCNIPNVFKKMKLLTPVLVIDEIGYNLNERPVHQSIEYHPGNRMNFKLIRSLSTS